MRNLRLSSRSDSTRNDRNIAFIKDADDDTTSDGYDSHTDKISATSLERIAKKGDDAKEPKVINGFDEV